MLLDVDLEQLAARHSERGNRCTLLLLRDPRQESFGSIGIDAAGCVRRIGRRFDLGEERAAGLFVGVRVLASSIFETLPAADQFEDLSDWFAPLLAAGARDICGEVLDAERCSWEPVGTPAEYLRVNLNPPQLPFMDRTRFAEEARMEGSLVVGTRARIGEGAQLERVVVWDGESVPKGLRASDGVFAGGRFHDCRQGHRGSSAVSSSRGRGTTT
jgi:NDP-sugar pyrophosphorylase family protein